MDELDDNLHEECGVVGVFAPGRHAARVAYFSLFSLQHRGQESAGIVTCDGHESYDHKGMGLISQAFNERDIADLKGHIAIGHNRYSTTGSSSLKNCSPFLVETVYGSLAVSHNGNLTNAAELRQKLLERGVGLAASTDSEVITQMLAAYSETWAKGHPHDLDRWERRLWSLLHVAKGAYSLAVMTQNALYAARDRNGLRPLCLGRFNDDDGNGGWIVASESCALATVDAEFVREVEPGELIRIDKDGLKTTQVLEPDRALCIFEYVYFARPDSIFEGQLIHDVRQKLGRQLARETDIEADIVIPVPDSAIPAAIGFSMESGIPYSEGLTKNRYIGRTFIQPDNQLRQATIKLKYNALDANLKGKRVIVLDDSIVRGNTSRKLIQLLRDGGAAEVHMLVSSPPVAHPCFMGIDMATYDQLIAHNYGTDEIQEQLGADSLYYLSLEGMKAVVSEAAADDASGHCDACFSGDYPIPVPEWLGENDRTKFIALPMA